MAVSYKKLLHRMIEEDISNRDLMRMSNISANIITKLLRKRKKLLRRP